MTPLEEYKSLLVRSYEVIDQPGAGWVEGRKALVDRMDVLWPRLTEVQQKWLTEVYCRGLYDARLARAEKERRP